MNKIHQLPIHEAQKIAAGEVVERPANVVKELIENSLDAGATSITVYLEQGGKKLIRIIDNGFGMSQADALMSIVHHATSKIKTVDELNTIETFGFRGEALSSIASVSTLVLITKEAEAQEATKLTIQYGTVIENTYAAAPQGTDIRIHDLFANVPARRKFLKTDETERRTIVQLFQALCLDYPHINFSIYHDDTLLHNCPAVKTLHERIHQLFDLRMYQHTHAAESTDSKLGLTINAVFSDHQYTRYDRSQIFFFVNRRWVKNYKLSQALIKGYMNVLPPGKYPAAVIALTLNTHDVDINIHPRKEEVQFLHPRAVEQALETFIKKQLEARLSQTLTSNSAHSMAMPQKFNSGFQQAPFKPAFTQSYDEQAHHHNPVTYPRIPQNTPLTFHDSEQSIPNTQEATKEPLSTAPKIHINVPKPVQTTFAHKEPLIQQSIVLGQLHKTYILTETAEGLTLIDQHAAHERILYEQFSERFEDVATVQLIFPQIITLKEQDLTTIITYCDLFKQHGIILDQTNATQLAVTSLPVSYKDHSVEDLIHCTLNWIHEFNNVAAELFFKKITEKLRAQMACKAAVKAGDQLTHGQMEALINTLVKTNNRLTCPHGRPTHWNMSLSDIEKMFKRT